MRVRSAERRKGLEVGAHLVPHRRIQRRFQCCGTIECHLVPLHEIESLPRLRADPIEARVDFKLTDAGKHRHAPRVVFQVMGMPGVQILSLAFVGDKIRAIRLAGRRSYGGVRHRERTYQHRLLGGFGLC